MAQQLTPINIANGDTFDSVYLLANTIVTTLATVVVTANNSTNGALTFGNGYISGIFGASSLVTNGLRGGSISNSANLSVTSNIVMTNTTTFYNGDTQINATAVVADNIIANNATIYNFSLNSITVANSIIGSFTYNATNTSIQTIDYFNRSTYRSAEYVLSLQDGGTNNYQCTKLLIIHNSNLAFITEYGMVTTNTSLGTLSAAINSTSIMLQLTPATSNVWINGSRIALKR